MTVTFLGYRSPYIIVQFDSESIYKYSGFELGFMNIMKRKYKRKPGKLIAYLKTLNTIICEKIS